MNRMLSYGAVALACCLLLAQPARAAFDTTVNVNVGDKVSFTGNVLPRTGNGGPFQGTITPASANSTWAAYCVESGTPPTTEYIDYNVSYKVQSITANIASATGNIATAAAKFLYYAAGHSIGSFSSVSYYDPSSPSDNAELQEAIWSLVIAGNSPSYNAGDVNPADGFATGNYNPGGPYTYLATATGDAASYRSWAISNLDPALASRISVLNPILVDGNGNFVANKQSMLVEVVPEPASLVVWSVLAGSAAGLTVARRKRRNAPAGRWSQESRSAIFAVVDKCE